MSSSAPAPLDVAEEDPREDHRETKEKPPRNRRLPVDEVRHN